MNNLSLRPYQMQAIASVTSHLRKNDRAQIQMACGTGKTVVGYEVVQKVLSGMKQGNVLVLFPNLNLIAQTIRSWKSYGFEGILAFCSDLAEDEAGEDVLHTTDAATLLANMEALPGHRVVFSTYQSSYRLVDAGMPVWDLVVFDEAHRAAGAATSMFATAVDDTLIPAKKRFYATATPRIAVTSDDEEGFTMDDVSRFGESVFRYSHKEAVDAGYINDFTLALVAVTNDELRAAIEREGAEGTDDTTLAYAAAAVALSKATREFKLRSTLTYHRTIDKSIEFAERLHKLDAIVGGEDVPELETYAVSSRDSAEAERVLERVRNSTQDERIVVSNCKLLGEGVDVPGLDSMSFVDPRRSVIDVTQAIGRIVRVDQTTGNRVGIVLLPVIVDQVGATADSTLDEESRTTLMKSNFSVVYETLNALQALDPHMSEELLITAHARSSAAKATKAEQETAEEAADDSGVVAGEDGWDSYEDVSDAVVELSNRVIGLGVQFTSEQFARNIDVVLAGRIAPQDEIVHRDNMYKKLVDENGLESAEALGLANWVYEGTVAGIAKAKAEKALKTKTKKTSKKAVAKAA